MLNILFINVTSSSIKSAEVNDLQREKTGNQSVQPGPTQTGLYNHRGKLES